MTNEEIQDPANAAIVSGLTRYCRQHNITQVERFMLAEVSCVFSGSWGPACEFVRAGMYHGVERNGHVHT
jgi:hypothetical protein